MATRVFAPAKVNLTLHVTGQRDDGYHLLDSLVAFADIGDWLTIEPADEISLTVSGPFADGVPVDSRNLAWQAAALYDQPVSMHLEKHLPHGAGIGGGSSDAAAVLNAMSDLTGQIVTGVQALGADVPVCRVGRVTRMTGIGDELTVLPPTPTLWAVLVNPGEHVPTPTVFAGLKNKANPPMPSAKPEHHSTERLMTWLKQMRNDLETPAIAQCPTIANVLKVISAQPGVGLARMSGSGATCFGLFDNRALAEIAARQISEAYPNWWVCDCQLS